MHLDPLTNPDDGRVAVTLPGISGWTLSPAEQAQLTSEVAPAAQLKPGVQNLLGAPPGR